MSDLVAFLNARLDEDEAAAREAYYKGQRWLTEEEEVCRWPDDEIVHHADRKADARHIARHDPARVLREVAAKRAIIAAHQTEVIKSGPEGTRYWCETCHIPRDRAGRDYCPTLRHLAAVYSGNADFLPEWALKLATQP